MLPDSRINDPAFIAIPRRINYLVYSKCFIILFSSIHLPATVARIYRAPRAAQALETRVTIGRCQNSARLISAAAFLRLGITFLRRARRERIDRSNDRLSENLPREGKREKRRRRRRRRRKERGRRKREREKQRLSKVQSSGHGAGHYMGFWGYGGGNRLPWDRSFSSSFLPASSSSLCRPSSSAPFSPPHPPTPSSAHSRRQNLYLAAATEMHPRLNGGRAFNGAANCETKNIWFPKEQP